MNPDPSTPKKNLIGISNIQQKLVDLRHDTGKSAAGSTISVIRTPWTLFQCSFQLLYNIEILLRYQYTDSVHDIVAVHKYAEYRMLAIRKDISFYASSSTLDKEEVLQVQESFEEALSLSLIHI